jgi:ABC-type enterobactin transport system permease subunit
VSPEDTLESITPQQLLVAAQLVVQRVPDTTLHKNPVGNLTILAGGLLYLGWINLRTGEVTFFEDDGDDEA